MREIIIDEATFESAEDVHAYLADELGFPAYYGANLDALNDCLGDVDEPCGITVYMNDSLPADAADEAGAFATWFPKLVRTLLRAARDNDSLEVLVHAGSLDALGRLAACPGLADMVRGEDFIVQGVVARLADAGEGL